MVLLHADTRLYEQAKLGSDFARNAPEAIVEQVRDTSLINSVLIPLIIGKNGRGASEE
jgi:hypothetical protein